MFGKEKEWRNLRGRRLMLCGVSMVIVVFLPYEFGHQSPDCSILGFGLNYHESGGDNHYRAKISRV